MEVWILKMKVSDVKTESFDAKNDQFTLKQGFGTLKLRILIKDGGG